eukprot:jgi/Botrbrau1/6120/Bobra.331_2s0015.1
MTLTTSTSLRNVARGLCAREQCRVHAARPRCCPPRAQLDGLQRRGAILGGLLAACIPSGLVREAQAGVVEDLAKAWTRPSVSPEEAVMRLMDAKGTLQELRALAATPSNSRERFEARALLPGMAARLREVASAAPVAAGLATGGDGEASLSALYGGKGDELGAAVPVYNAIGRVVTISGRTIRPEAQASPDLADEAIVVIEELLGKLPREIVSEVEAARQQRLSGLQ